MVAVNQIRQTLTLAEFLELPETKPASEYVNGQIEQKPMPQGEHSTLQTRLGTAINEVVLPKKIAHAFTELRCTFGGRSIVPDITLFSWNRIPKTEKGRIANKFELYPDWVIEILSPEQSANKVIKKILFCLNQGTELGWLIDPEDESVMIFQPKQLPEIKSDEEILPVLESLKDWQLSVAEMFSWLSVK
ncbi:Uma2 family endonuclease [Moorena sp. SIO4G3]|uniref:Uma2 family endonuclease n=1 Tax=Moorena sp. SIO4G3 TaxID=2607821 RepID=UPI00142CA8B6|nr:Uma2 family endonuclease [Moorena sp. SIO4G3]